MLASLGLQTYQRLLSYLRPLRAPFCAGLFGAALFAASQNAFLWFLEDFLDGTFLEHDPDMLAWVPLGILILFIVRGLGDFMQTYCMSLTGRGIVSSLRLQLFERLMHLPMSYYDTTASGTLLSRLTYNTEQAAQAASDSAVSVVRESLLIVGSLIYLFSVNAYLACVALFTAPVIALLMRKANRYFRRYGKRIQTSMSELTRVAKEAIEAPRAIRTCNAQPQEIARFAAVNERTQCASMRAALTKALSNPIVQLLAAASLAVVFGIAIRQALAGEITPGQLAGFVSALGLMTQPLRNLVNAASPLQQGIAAADSIFEIIDEPIEPNAGSHFVQQARGEVEYRGVGFRYSDTRHPAIQRISFRAEPGKVIAVIGTSGSGKSTLLNLLPRLYRATSGTVLLDGIDVEHYELHSLRAQIAVVSQDITLFNDTLRNNIAFGTHAADEQIERAAATARVLDFARELPQRLQTLVGDRGSLLSGGQRQRVAIARALLKDAPILVLDEATCALDSETEHAVQAGIEALMQQRTTFVVAHRLVTVERADHILVMHEGRIVEAGTHTELLARNGRYAALYHRQFADS